MWDIGVFVPVCQFRSKVVKNLTLSVGYNSLGQEGLERYASTYLVK
jgi:hypothetical protein